MISIDIGSNKIKIVQGKNSRNNIIIKKSCHVTTPLNSFKEGEIQNIIALKSTLKDAIRKYKIRGKQVIVISKNASVISRIIEIPYQKKPKNIEAMVNYEIKQYLPINIEDYIIKHELINQQSKVKQQYCEVRVTVYPKKLAKAYWDLMKELGLKPIRLDISSSNITKVVKYFSEHKIKNQNQERQSIIAMDFGHELTELNFISNGQLKFTRMIPCGGKEIDELISRELIISEEKAEKVKINICNLNEHKKELFDDMNEIDEQVKNLANQWLVQVAKIIDYYKNVNKNEAIDAVYLYGGLSKLKGLRDYMEKMLDIRVKYLDEVTGFEGIKGIEKETMSIFANAIGGLMVRGRN